MQISITKPCSPFIAQSWVVTCDSFSGWWRHMVVLSRSSVILGRVACWVCKLLHADQNMSLQDTNNPKLAPRTLEALLRARVSPQDTPEFVMGEPLHAIESFAEESVATIDDACNLCYEQPMDCVMTPCGHQLCCSDCGSKLTTCPLCKVNCSVLKVFRR